MTFKDKLRDLLNKEVEVQSRYTIGGTLIQIGDDYLQLQEGPIIPFSAITWINEIK